MATVIKVENLGKKYLIQHQQRERYTALRDVLTNKFKSFGKRLISLQPHSFNFQPSREEFWALKDVSFEVKQGDRVGIIGRNGAGKTTLLKLLSRITEPTTGRIAIKGRVASLLEVGTGFHPELTGRENIFLNGAILGMSKAEIRRKFDEIVGFAELERFIDTPVKRYSSGMYVRLAFAVAAHLEPEILLVDEVLAVGDAAFQKKCLGKMGKVSEEGRTVLFVSHNMPAVERLCNRVHLLDQGRIMLSSDPVTVLDAYYKATADREKTAVHIRDVPDGTVRFIDWSIHSSTGDQFSSYSGEACTFQFRLGLGRTVKEANFGIALWANDGTLVWAMRNIDHGGQCLLLHEGIYELHFTVTQLPLRPGAYQILVSANDLREGTLDSWYAQPKLQVLSKNESGLPIQWQGLLNLRGEFRLSIVTSQPAGGNKA